MAKAMLEDAEERGLIKPGVVSTVLRVEWGDECSCVALSAPSPIAPLLCIPQHRLRWLRGRRATRALHWPSWQPQKVGDGEGRGDMQGGCRAGIGAATPMAWARLAEGGAAHQSPHGDSFPGGSTPPAGALSNLQALFRRVQARGNNARLLQPGAPGDPEGGLLLFC